MDRSTFGATAEAIGKLTDTNQLQAMLKNPQYAGYTSVIIARLTEINHERQAAQAQAPQPPTVAQQAVQGSAPPQTMAKGGIVAFKQGGKVKKEEPAVNWDDYKYTPDDYVARTPAPAKKGELAVDEPQEPDISDITADRPASDGIRGFVDGGDLRSGKVPPAPEGLPDTYIPPSRSFGDWSDDMLYGHSKKRDAQYAAATDADKAAKTKGIRVALPQAQTQPDYAEDPNDAPDVQNHQGHPFSAQDIAYLQGIHALPGSPVQPNTTDTTQASAGSRDGGSTSTRTSGSSLSPEDIKPYLIPDRTDAQRWNDMQNIVGKDARLEDLYKRMDANDARQNAQYALNGPLSTMEAGLRTMQDAAEHPLHGIASNLASGASTGLSNYQQRQANYNAGQNEELKARGILAGGERQERLGLLKDMMTDRGQDVRSNSQVVKDMVNAARYTDAQTDLANRYAAGQDKALHAQTQAALLGQLKDARQGVAQSLADLKTAQASAAGPTDPALNEARQRYNVAMGNVTDVTNALSQHTGLGVNQQNPADRNSWIRQTPQGTQPVLQLAVPQQQTQAQPGIAGLPQQTYTSP